MAINYDKLLEKTPVGIWFTGEELQKVWKVSYTVRKARVKVLVRKGFLQRRGRTTSVQYIIASGIKTTEPRMQHTALDSLINSASAIGTENKILKQALTEIKKIINEATEVTL